MQSKVGQGLENQRLLNIIAGLIENYKGDILVNGSNLRTIDKSSWFNKISIVPQNIFINEDTLLNNVILDDQSKKFQKKLIKQIQH